MSVTVYPYLTDPNNAVSATETNKNTKPAVNSTTNAEETNFANILANASRHEQAMAVDALIAQNHGGVDVETVKRVLGFDPMPGMIMANAKMEIKIPTMENQNPNAATQNGTTAGSASATGGASKANSSSAKTTYAAPTGPKATMDELERAFSDASRKYNVDIDLLKSIAKAESNFDSNATSSSGAMGVMQLMPVTAQSLGIKDGYNYYDNIMGGAQVIAQHLDKYDGNLALALAAYNAGPGNVDKYGGIPPFEETQNYVKKVIGYYNS